MTRGRGRDPVAVIGMDCRFPGAADVDGLWQLLMDGAVTAREIPDERWDIARFHSSEPQPGTMNTRRAHFIDDADLFDNDFFGIAPLEAAALDPQQRLVLQSAWRALEDAAIDPRSLAGSDAGVFVGMMLSEWGALNLLDYPGMTAHRGIGGGHAMVANRVSYHLNLTGPSVTVDTACSSSLTAVHLGVRALTAGDTDLVVASGVNILLTPALSIFYTLAGLSAPDGTCKPFSANADGIGRGEGVGTVVLRRLADAVAEGQPVHAVIAGSATNQDGKSSGITAPNRWAQTNVVQRALERAGLDARDIAFVEAHGTGTTLGDMIETNALGDLHRTGREAPCLIGSIKGNIGHTEGAAGMASLIKACLAVSRRTLPPTVCTAGPNPALRLDQQGLALATAATDLGGGEVRGGVSSFGIGGSNVHIVITGPPEPTGTVREVPGDDIGVVTVSAHSPEALHRNAVALANVLDACDDHEVPAVCYTSNRVKSSLPYRLSAAGSRSAMVGALIGDDPSEREHGVRRGNRRLRIGLLCTGQGAQYPGMTAALYGACPPYREHMKAAAAAVDASLAGPNGLLTTVFRGGGAVDRTEYAQPALFAVAYAMGAALLDLGVEPTFVMGHSVGEFAAAVLAEVLTLEEAAGLVVARGAAMQRLPGGVMCAVDVEARVLAELAAREADCAVAAINAPAATVLSGPAEAVGRITAALIDDGAVVTPLAVSHAFHSPLVAPAQGSLRAVAAAVTPRKAAIPLVSTVRGTVLDGTEMDADYWVEQVTATVRFAEALQTATSRLAPTHLVELGPRTTLLGHARRSGLRPGVATLAPCTGPDDDGAGLARVVARLYGDGLTTRFERLYGAESRTLKRLPPYVFGGTRFWRTPLADAVSGAVDTVAAPSASTESVSGDSVADPPGAASEPAATRIRRLVAEVGGYPVEQVGPASRLAADLGYDSLLQLRLVESVRAEYPCLHEVSAAELLTAVTDVDDVVRYVADRLAEVKR